MTSPLLSATYANLRFYLTDTIIKMLQVKAEIKPSLFIDYKKLADLRANTPDFYMLSPVQVGEKLGADLVLVVTISRLQDYQYRRGGLATVLLTPVPLFTRSRQAKNSGRQPNNQSLFGVGFESERRGRDAACVRLAAAAAHCVTRYLYDCPKAGFKISDERTASGWEK